MPIFTSLPFAETLSNKQYRREEGFLSISNTGIEWNNMNLIAIAKSLPRGSSMFMPSGIFLAIGSYLTSHA